MAIKNSDFYYIKNEKVAKDIFFYTNTNTSYSPNFLVQDSDERIGGTLATNSQWEKTISISHYFNDAGTVGPFVKTGYFPQFETVLHSITTHVGTNGWDNYRLRFDLEKNAFIFESHHGALLENKEAFWSEQKKFTAADFKDNTLPKRMLMVIQGSGGGGGLGGWPDGGGGGGSGGYLVAVINTELCIEHAKAGYNCYWLFKTASSSSGMGGIDGHPSGYPGANWYVYWHADFGSYTSDILLITVYGGQGGKNGNSNDYPSGGAGGNITIESAATGFLWLPQAYNYALKTWQDAYQNGCVGNAGKSEDSVTRYSDKTNIYLFKNQAYYNAAPNYLGIGGKHTGQASASTTASTNGHDSAGAPSFFADGGGYNKYGDGNDGSLGSGGAGGDGAFLGYHIGGKGGVGFIKFYY